MKVFTAIGCRLRCTLGVLFTIMALTAPAGSAMGDVDIDIRSEGTLSTLDTVRYTVRIDDCSTVASVQVSAGDTLQKVSPSRMQHVSGTDSAYEFSFNAAGTGRYDPEVAVAFVDGSTQVHSESFHAVSPEGVVYPLADTSQENIFITVTYPGLPALNVPVEVDLNKQLVSLRAQGLNGQGQWVLERLNIWLPLPAPIVAVFNDASESEISAQFPLEYVLAETAAGVVELDAVQGILAKAVVTGRSGRPQSTPKKNHGCL